MRARTRWARWRLASALAALLGGCVAAEDLELPPAPSGTRAGVVVALVPDASGRDRVLGAQGFELGTPNVWALPNGVTFALLYYDRALDELGLERGPLRMALQNERTRPLPEPRLAFTRAVDGAGDWAPLAPEDRPAVSLPDFLAEDCVERGGCIGEDDAGATRCVVPCPEPTPVTPPAPPMPIIPPEEASCPIGWSLSAPSRFGGTSCVPDAAGLDCPEGQYLALGLGSCAPLGPTCPAPSEPFAPDPAPARRTFYVQSGRPTGAGTRASPFGSLDEAIEAARSGDRIMLSTGEHRLGARALADARDVELVGACAEGTVLRGSITIDRSSEITVRDLHVIATSTRAAVLVRASNVRLEDVHLTGARAALALGAASTATLARSLVTDLDREVDEAESALDVGGRSWLRLEDVEVRAPHRHGLYAAGAATTVELRGVAVRDAGTAAITVLGARVAGVGLLVERAGGPGIELATRATAELEHVVLRDGAANRSAALDVGGLSEALVRGARFERNAGQSVSVTGGSHLVLERALALESLTESAYGGLGASGAHLTLRGVLVEGFGRTGVFGDHAVIDGNDVGIWPGAPRSEAQDGIYLFASDARLTRVRIEGARGRGINHTTTIDPPEVGRLLPATAELEDLDVRDTAPNDGGECFGLLVNRSATVSVSRASIVGTDGLAIYIGDTGTRGTLEDVDVRGAARVAVHLRDPVHVRAKRVAIDDVRGLGVWISTTAVDTLEEPDVTMEDLSLSHIDGPAALSTLGRSRTAVASFAIRDVSGTGVEVLDRGVALRSGEVDRALVGLSAPTSYDVTAMEALLYGVRFGPEVTQLVERPSP